MAADTVDAALASLTDSTVIAEDQAIGNYRWKIVESSTLMKGVIARGAATPLTDGEHYLTIMLGAPENSADAGAAIAPQVSIGACSMGDI